jgi:SulP family sulfate permease
VQKKSVHRLFPFLEWLPRTTQGSLKKDFVAGLTGAVISLPQGVAFALIAGMPPIYGLYSAMITPIIAALFGSSNHMISGPATAISIVIFSSVSSHGVLPGTPDFVALALVITLVAGVIQLAMGIARLGTLVNFISHTVIIGFTAGAAILIAVKQMKHALGLELPGGLKFHEIIIAIGENTSFINYNVLMVTFVTLAMTVLGKIFAPKLPYMLVAMVIGSYLAYYLGGESAGIALIGEMPSNLPPFHFPKMNLELIAEIAPDAFAIALLGLIEAVAIARSLAMLSGQKIDSNQEFVGQGLSNIVGSVFSSFAGSGSFTRSGLNYQSGAQTPLAAVFAALLLMLIVIFIAPLAAYLPIAAMAGIIFFVAFNLIDAKHIKEILSVSGRETAVFIITFFATLFLKLEFAIYIGVIFSLIFYLQRTSTPRVVPMGMHEKDGENLIVSSVRKKRTQKVQGVSIARIDGSIFFGSVSHVQDKLNKIMGGNNTLLIVGNSINMIDMPGAEMLVHMAKELKKKGGGLYISGLKRRTRSYLLRGSFWKDIGLDNIHEDEYQALEFIKQVSSADTGES